MAHVWAIGKPLPKMHKLAALLLSLAAVCSVHAREDPNLPFTFSPGGGTATLGKLPLTSGNAGNFVLKTASDGTLLINTNGKMPVPGGGTIPLDVIGKVPKSTVGAALGKFAAKGLPLLNTGVALYELASELGMFATNTDGGVPSFSKPKPGVCSVSLPYSQGSGDSPSAACASAVADMRANYPRGDASGFVSGNYCYYVIFGSTGANAISCANTPGTDPVTTQQFLDAVAARSGWPESSALGRAVLDALKSGETVEVEPQSVSGPSSVDQGTNKTTTAIPSLPSTSTTASFNGAPGSAGGPAYVADGKIGNGYRDVRVAGVSQFTGGSMSSQLPGTTVKLPTSITSSTTYNPSTNTTTRVTTTEYPGGSVDFEAASTTAVTYPPGTPPTVATKTSTTVKTTTKDADGNVVSEQSTTDQNVKPQEPSITCGLPGTPACKIDETGTMADKRQTFDDAKTELDTAKTKAGQAIDAAANITAPSWSFTFALPTGCAPYVTGIRGFILNVCQFQSQIHGLLSAVWAATTIFAMIGMVGRTIRSA